MINASRPPRSTVLPGARQIQPGTSKVGGFHLDNPTIVQTVDGDRKLSIPTTRGYSANYKEGERSGVTGDSANGVIYSTERFVGAIAPPNYQDQAQWQINEAFEMPTFFSSSVLEIQPTHTSKVKTLGLAKPVMHDVLNAQPAEDEEMAPVAEATDEANVAVAPDS